MSQVVEFFMKRLNDVGDNALKDYKYYGINYLGIREAYNKLGLVCPIHLVENVWLRRYPNEKISHGWGNGYVMIPEGHKFYGLGYVEINDEGIDINGGLTFAEMIDEDNKFFYKGYWIGFDTSHSWDTMEKWSESEVLKETIKLFFQIR